MSVVALVVIVTLLPASKVNVSLFESATTVDCPDTAKFLNMFCDEPKSVFVIVTEPVDAETLIPAPAVTDVTAVVRYPKPVTKSYTWSPVAKAEPPFATGAVTIDRVGVVEPLDTVSCPVVAELTLVTVPPVDATKDTQAVPL